MIEQNTALSEPRRSLGLRLPPQAAPIDRSLSSAAAGTSTGISPSIVSPYWDPTKGLKYLGGSSGGLVPGPGPLSSYAPLSSMIVY
jgi:hypothetical protein